MGCVCITDGEIYQVQSERWRKARVEHHCCECGATIKHGDRYQYFSGLFDGRWENHKTCRICATIRVDYYTCALPPLGLLAYYLNNDYEVELC